ncbi:BTAD domain-containing putative transcriptional regulator [Amycolatopsis pithecellobii]|uniref:AAA family ATPase n=1 Tax=Amycolatopsis pithecellobii TaxID=664692 RepID=A0A6N7Z3S3_9PSEU|nr:BTAD domain-containing putative transcriptional regulator [Amycolatopsis pithecellobii]MTD55839.1 AAA family ATPase [Amycolatopsis pithecellobii]
MTGDNHPGLWFQVLGSVRGWHGENEIDLGSAHRRAVLAVLAISAGHTVSRHELIDALWGEQPPSSAAGSIYTYISGLRRALEPDRAPRSSGHLLASVGSGYSLQIDRERLDLHRFHELRTSGAQQRKAGRPQDALAELDAALELWHGDALAGLPGPFAATQRAKLGELRLTTVETRAEVLLDLGRHNEVIAELSALAQEHPLRERLRALLMRALHEDGRTAEALEVFTEARETLIETSGIEPGPELRRLHEQLLSGTTPGRPAPAATVAPAPPTLPARADWRPERTDVFVGRSDERQLLHDTVSAVLDGRGGVVWVEGEAGIGKTALFAEVLSEVLASTDVGETRLRWATAQEIDSGMPAQLIRDYFGFETVQAGVEHVLENVAGLLAQGPLILVADQFQWADAASLSVWSRLAELTERLPLLLVSAARPTPGRAGLVHLRQRLARTAELITLGPLEHPEVVELAERLVGVGLSARIRSQIDLAAGNPHYLREIIAAAAEQSQHGDRMGAAPGALPARLVARINDHVSFLPGPALSMLQWATLLGDSFTYADLTATVGRDLADLAGDVEEALAAGFLVADGESLRFRHKIVQLALHEKTPAPMRAALHRQFAETLAANGAPAVRVAEHLAATSTATDSWVSGWLADNVGMIAAEKPYVAIGLLRQVIGSTARGPQGDGMLAVLARLLFWLGTEPESEARSLIARSGDPDRAAEMRWILAYGYYRSGRTAEALSEVDTALADARVTGRWRERHELLRAELSGNPHEENLSAPIAELAQLPLLDADTRAMLGGDRSGAPYVAATWELAPDRALPAEIHLANAISHYWMCEWAGAQAELDALTGDDQVYKSYLLRHAGVTVYALAALIAIMRDEAETAARHVWTAVSHADSVSLRSPASDFLFSAKSELALMNGHPEEAISALAPLVNAPVRPLAGYLWLPRLARLAVTVGDTASLERIRQALAEWSPVQRATNAFEVVGRHCRAIIDDDPDELLRLATIAATRIGTNLISVRTVDDAAWLLARHGRKSEARDQLVQASTIYRRLGARYDLRRMFDAMRALGYPATAPV